ncbi:hypothetical protein CIB48_g8768 [Xylaria polymorpha]|nr:hypothetical protein CIB48_g8768 [Xylaria polymorpha]
MVVIIFAAGLCHANGKRFTIGIITPYNAQCKILTDTIGELSTAEVVHDLIDVRTVSGMQGHEPDIVIADHVRTASTGFVKQRTQGSVMTSRDKYANIYVGNTMARSKTSRQGKSCQWLLDLEKYHFNRSK